jgi:DNA-binding CsgD family transcriptional regulator
VRKAHKHPLGLDGHAECDDTHTGALLERERELATLEAALTAARAGRGQVVLVEAAAGLGKTSLLRAACEIGADMGFATLRVRATELERDFAFGCVRQLLGPVVTRASEPKARRLFDHAAALSEPLFAELGTSTLSPSSDTAHAMLYGLYWLLNNLVEDHPLLLSVDDAHWSDVESLRFLVYLTPRLDGLTLAIVASTRTEGVTAELAQIATAPEALVLRPRPLSAVATATLCERQLGVQVAPEFAAACREVSGGNPFFLEELLREAVEQQLSMGPQDVDRLRQIGPSTVTQALLLRLSAIPGAHALVRAVAVLGDGSNLAEAANLAGLSPEEAARVADQLVRMEILRPRTSLEFVHPIVRESVYKDIGSYERAVAHARAAEILAARGASDERVAAQIVEAEPGGESERVSILCRVAEGALVRGAPAAAVAWLSRALAEPPPPEARGQVLLELGSAQLRLGVPEAICHLAEAVELISDPPLLARSVRNLALALTLSGDADRSVAAIESAIDAVEGADREVALVLEADLAAHAQQASLEARVAAVGRLERYAGLDGATPGERLVLASLAFERGRVSESASDAAQHMERALAGGRLLAEQEVDVAGPFYHLVIGLLATDALDLLDECLDQALADARTRGSIPAVGLVTAYRARLLLQRGAVDRAESDARTALELLAAHGVRLGVPIAQAFLIEALVERGELDTAEEALQSGPARGAIPPGLTSNFLLEARGVLHLAQGRTSEALNDLSEFGRRDELWGGASPLASRWRSRASLALAMAGDEAKAFAMAAEDLTLARRWGAPSGIGVALQAVARANGGMAAIQQLREAVNVLEGSPARLEHAHALIDLGAALRRANHRSDAQNIFHQGVALATSCGARRLAARGLIELRAAGGRPRKRGHLGREQLTVSEHRVAELASAGRSNPEIAQTLFVTRKTVETHLSRVYRKLGITGRDELAWALAQFGPPTGS